MKAQSCHTSDQALTCDDAGLKTSALVTTVDTCDYNKNTHEGFYNPSKFTQQPTSRTPILASAILLLLYFPSH